MSQNFDHPAETFVEDPPDLIELADELPLLPVRDVVIFPNMVAPLFVGREESVAAVESALSGDHYLLLVTQRQADVEQPEPEDLFSVGVLASVLKGLKLADGRLKILVQGLQRMEISPKESPTDFLQAGFNLFGRPEPEGKPGPEVEGLIRSSKEMAEKILSLKGLLSQEVVSLLESIQEPGRLADLVASNLRLRLRDSQRILEAAEPVERLKLVHGFLARELEVTSVVSRIQSAAKEEMGRGQREYYLREQLKAIRRELGEADERAEEAEAYLKAIEEAKPSEEATKEAHKQLRRLEQMSTDSAEAALIRTYLDWLTELPWSASTRDRLDLKRARRILDQDHYDLNEVKDRILEYLAVRKLKRRLKGPILCFVGPPGVGKTSLGRSIARALGRKFTRISLGGVHDEAEIRGHRRTYVGALPGRILQGLKTAGSHNPVFMMDEIDKIGMDFRGDPAAALLEVLDPEQNDSFSDHYLNLPFDLSRVMFLTTANQTETIPQALYDRLEIIEIPGYTENEKVKIARRFLLPRQIKENGLKNKDLTIRDRTIREIINNHTREAGLRGLERALSKICRKAARRKAEGKRMPLPVGPSRLDKLLGPPQFLPELEQKEDEVGVVTGLAWTSVGGEVLFIEVSLVKGKGSLLLTGQLGEVMKESAEAALTYIRARTSWLALPDDFYDNLDLHIHLPAAAIPKDGPSAGVSLTAALVSALTGIPVKKEVAMTGEISLRGHVLPVGGLKEKSLAALRAGVKKLILPAKNHRDLVEIPKEVRQKIELIEVESMDQVLTAALTRPLPGPKPVGPLLPPLENIQSALPQPLAR
jgi:ATP-dependent Lon protease